VCFGSSAIFLGVSDVHEDDCWLWGVNNDEGVFVIMRNDRTHSGLKEMRSVTQKVTFNILF